MEGAATALGVHIEDLPGLQMSCGASLTLMGAYYFIQPLSDSMALQAGIEATPLVTVASLGLVLVCNPLYALMCNWLPLSSVQPVLHRILSVCLALFAFQFAMLTRESLTLSFSFAVFLGAFAPFLMSTFWVRMAHMHTQREAHRIYGVIAAGAQCGELLASVAAPALFGRCVWSPPMDPPMEPPHGPPMDPLHGAPPLTLPRPLWQHR